MRRYPDRIILCDIAGSMAHFRKFYTNSSSLSYSFPPRTTLCGLIAGILGKRRDSYYEDFSMTRCRIGLSLRVSVRRVIQRVNYVRTKSLSEVDASAGHTQVPLELIMPAPEEKKLVYRVYFWHENDELMEELWERLQRQKYVYPPYLGITECPAEVPWATLVEGENIKWLTNPEKPVMLFTVIPVTRLREGGLCLEEGIQILKDRMPLDLASDRTITAIDDLLYERNGRPLKLIPTGEVYSIRYKDSLGDREEQGVFMEV